MDHDDKNKLLKLAIHNNAAWCGLVCRSYGLSPILTTSAWIVKDKTPEYYPNVITLEPAGNGNGLLRIIKELTLNNHVNWSVKDSYADLELSQLGFSILFDSEWIVAPRSQSELVDKAIDWRIIESSNDLLDWEDAWGKSTSKGLFKSDLLDNPEIKIIAGYKEGEIITGSIANKSEGVVGMSNLFFPGSAPTGFWHANLQKIEELFPALTIVGYESGAELGYAKMAGCQELGDLRIWGKS